MEGIESSHKGRVVERVLLVLVVSSNTSSGVSQLGLDLIGVDDSGKVSAGHNRSVHVVAALFSGSIVVGSEDGSEGSEGRLGEDKESSEVTTRGKLEDVESVDVASVNTWKVSGGSLNAILFVVVDEEGSLSDNVL